MEFVQALFLFLLSILLSYGAITYNPPEITRRDYLTDKLHGIIPLPVGIFLIVMSYYYGFKSSELISAVFDSNYFDVFIAGIPSLCGISLGLQRNALIEKIKKDEAANERRNKKFMQSD